MRGFVYALCLVSLVVAGCGGGGGGPRSAGGSGAFRTVSLQTNDLEVDPATNLVWASIPGTAASRGNTVVPINPLSASPMTGISIGSEPSTLAISGDGRYLYVGLAGAGAIRRVDLTTSEVGPLISLGNDSFTGPYFPEDIEVAPGSNTVIAVSRRNIGFSPGHEGVVIFDDGVQLPNETADHTGSNRLEWGTDGTRLYGLSTESSDAGFYRLDVDGSGVAELDVVTNLLGPSSDFEHANGMIYGTTGRVVDAEAGTLVATLPGMGSATSVLAVPARNRVYALDSGTVRTYNLTDFTLVRVTPIPLLDDDPYDLVAYGANGVAFRTAGKVYLLDNGG